METVKKIEFSSIGELFDHTALIFKNKKAISNQEIELSYGMLYEFVGKFITFFSELGIVKGTHVGIIISDKLTFIFSIIAIAKIGAVYIPIDNKQPLANIKYILEISKADLFLYDLEPILDLKNCLSVFINRKNIIDKYSSTKLTSAGINRDDPIYIMFSSGSTGKPKGIIIPHRGVLRLVYNTDWISINHDDIFSNISNISFDGSTFDIWGALLNGAELFLPPNNFIPNEIGEILYKSNTSIVFLTTTLFNLFVENNINLLANLKKIVFGGEKGSLYHIKKAISELPAIKIINGYGPTENTTFTATYTFSKKDLNLDFVPIGNPILHTTCYILNEKLEKVKDGETGELYTGGDGLAISYIDQTMTEEKFIFHNQIGERLYKTGDIVKFHSDIGLEFIGRIDSQVKVRGMRIELTEIESALNKHPLIYNSVVVCDGLYEDKKLIAFCKISDDTELLENSVKLFLKNHLPEYSIPDHIQIITKLPINKNGKTDIQELIENFKKSLSKNHSEDNSEDNSEGHSKTIYSIWEKVLNINSFDHSLNFFSAGGNSLLALKLILEIENKLKIKLPSNYIFKYPEYQEFIKFLDKKENDLICLKQGKKKSFYFIPWVNAPLSLYKHLAESLESDYSIFVLNTFEIDKFSTITEVADFYCKIILNHNYSKEVQISGSSLGGIVAFEVAILLEKSCINVNNVFLLDSPETEFMIKTLETNFSKLDSLLYELIWLPRGFFIAFKYQKLNSFLKSTLKDLKSKIFKFRNNKKNELNETELKIIELIKKSSTSNSQKTNVILLRSIKNFHKFWKTDKYLGWKKVLSEIKLEYVLGNHTGMLENEYAGILAQIIKKYLV